ncbi:hypothetical protein BH11BAC3_BH11BAC3_47360 [soil metagenome]
MKRLVSSVVFAGIINSVLVAFCSGQIVDFSRSKPYRKVFVETDNFGASYLSILQAAYPKISDDTLQLSMLNDLAYYWHTRNLDSALYFTNEGLKISRTKKFTLWEGRFLITKGAILLRMEKLDSAYHVLESAKQKVKEADLPFLNTQLGYVFERRGQLDTAADYALESLKLGKKLNDKKAIALAYSDLSNLFWKQSKFDLGLEYGLNSLNTFEERGINDLDYDFTLYVVGNNYLSLKKYTDALNYYEHSITIGERYGFYNNLSDVYISRVDLYAYLNEFTKASAAGVNAIKYADLLNNNFMLMRSWLSVGKLQYLQGKYVTSIASLQKCIEIATSNFGDNFFLSKAYETLGKAYAGNHNYQDAYIAFAAYDKHKSAVFTAEADERISLLQTKFDVAKKETTIGSQKTMLKQQRVTQTYIIIIAGLLLLFLAIVFMLLQGNRRKNKLLLQQNKEKEFLLKEIHHRVKNNLEIISSLLSLQSEQITDPNVVEAMQESQNRVHSMSMIHQRLYQGKNLATIEMRDFFINLGSHVADSFGAEGRIAMEYKMDVLELDVDTAVPLGLIVNEVLTNAFKHAFPNKREGSISIALKQTDTNQLKLTVMDDGIGQQAGTVVKASGFGKQLISLLMQQLDGKMETDFSNGTAICFSFKHQRTG